MKKIYYKRNSTEQGMLQDTTAKTILPDIDSWEFAETFYPNYYTCPDIAYLNDLTAFLDGDTDRQQLNHNQPNLKGLKRDTIKKEWKKLMQLVLNNSVKHFYQMVCSGMITIIYD